MSAGAVMHQTGLRDIREMGGFAGRMPFASVSSIVAALSIAGSPPFACFISEFLIFVGAFDVIRTNSFYILPTVFMVLATVFSLAYSLRFVYRIFIAPAKDGVIQPEKGSLEISNSMKLSLLLLVVFVVLLGVYPGFFINLINTVGFI